ncbi:MAG: IS110 family transposase [Trueperaceae bacterium]|nr:IS110 family transposase [Trueperaceae bacterium]MDZ7801182.1 IS110 family transposase [Trueperaceae bacterium]
MIQDTSSVSPCIAGVDIGDDTSSVCILDAASGDVLEETRVRTRVADVERYFARLDPLRVAIETGTHSSWIARAISDAGQDVTIANAAHVRLIHGSKRKNDRLDAEKLGRLLRYDRALLAPITHRGRAAQLDLSVLRARDALVRARTLLINHVRGVVKSYGQRIPKCETSAFSKHAASHVPPDLLPALQPQIEAIAHLTEQIRSADRRVAELCRTTHPETAVLTQVHGVAETTALTYVLTLEDPNRFHRSRDVGAYLGLTPGQRQSGGRDPDRHITKAGDRALRRLLIQCAQRILGKRGIDSDLKRHGQRIMQPGTKEAKRRAVVAVARKLAILLHRLWITGEVYEPLHNNQPKPTPLT